MANETMTYVHVSSATGEPTRIAFDPTKQVADYRKASDGTQTTSLYDLYVRDCDEQPGESWIEDPDGGYAYPPTSVRKRAAMQKTTAQQDRAMAPDAPAPDGYGALIQPESERMPTWLEGFEVVARHLPCGLSERKASYVTTWIHPFRLRNDHPYYG